MTGALARANHSIDQGWDGLKAVPLSPNLDRDRLAHIGICTARITDDLNGRGALDRVGQPASAPGADRI